MKDYHHMTRAELIRLCVDSVLSDMANIYIDEYTAYRDAEEATTAQLISYLEEIDEDDEEE